MKKTCLFINSLLLTIMTYAQTEKFDIATFTPPQGWERTNGNGSVAFFHSQTGDGLNSFCQIILYSSNSSKANTNNNFKTAWQSLVAVPTKSKAKPVTQTEKTPDGWRVVTGTANVTFQGMQYTTILVNITGFRKSMNVQVNTAGGDYALTIKNFFNELDLDSKATPPTNPQSDLSNQAGIGDYDFIAPEGWQLENKKDHLLINNPQSGCTIRILQQPSSGNLEQDSKAIFNTMYEGWQYQQDGRKQYVLSKGLLSKGLEYCMMEATMNRADADGRYNLEEGAALVVKAGTKIVIISVRHSGLLAHSDCVRKYNTWRRFFNSFTVKNVPVAKNQEDPAKRIIGKWSMLESGATGEYIFAANGHYALIGAIGSTFTTSDYNYEYLHIKTYAFQGDGTYSIHENQLTLKKRSSGSTGQIRFRFEKVNYGGTGWEDRIYLLNEAPADGGQPYEACYEKSPRK